MEGDFPARGLSSGRPSWRRAACRGHLLVSRGVPRVSSHAVLSSLYGLSRWYAAKRQPPLIILLRNDANKRSESGSVPAGILAAPTCAHHSIRLDPIGHCHGGSSVPLGGSGTSLSHVPPRHTRSMALSQPFARNAAQTKTHGSAPIRFDRRRRTVSGTASSRARQPRHAPRAASRRYTAGSPARPRLPLAPTSRPARRSPRASSLSRLRISSFNGSDKWRSGLNRRSRKSRVDRGQGLPGSATSDGQAEPERHRDGQEAGGSIPEEPAGDLIAQARRTLLRRFRE